MPFQLTVDVLLKLVPVAVNVNAVLPAVMVFGDTEVSPGLRITAFT